MLLAMRHGKLAVFTGTMIALSIMTAGSALTGFLVAGPGGCCPPRHRVPQETRVESACEGCMTGCLKRLGLRLRVKGA
jgi:hypothetical protein